MTGNIPNDVGNDEWLARFDGLKLRFEDPSGKPVTIHTPISVTDEEPGFQVLSAEA